MNERRISAGDEEWDMGWGVVYACMLWLIVGYRMRRRAMMYEQMRLSFISLIDETIVQSPYEDSS